VHEYGYTIEMSEDGPSFRDPRSRPVLTIPAGPSNASAGLSAIFAGNATLGITAQTNQCTWDGSRVDYPEAIDYLVRADHLD
jgi:hypothetical protein